MKYRDFNTLDHLTARELEILLLLVKGLSNREIADELIISRHTAQNHVHNIFSKLGLTSRYQVIFWALRMGVVEMNEIIHDTDLCPCVDCERVRSARKEDHS